MSPELETLDQLLAGDMSLAIVQSLYADEKTFREGVIGLLTCGDVQLVVDGNNAPAWRWREIMSDPDALNRAKLQITKKGVRRIG